MCVGSHGLDTWVIRNKKNPAEAGSDFTAFVLFYYSVRRACTLPGVSGRGRFLYAQVIDRCGNNRLIPSKDLETILFFSIVLMAKLLKNATVPKKQFQQSIKADEDKRTREAHQVFASKTPALKFYEPRLFG